jgi:hypothetical protein
MKGISVSSFKQEATPQQHRLPVAITVIYSLAIVAQLDMPVPFPAFIAMMSCMWAVMRAVWAVSVRNGSRPARAGAPLATGASLLNVG